ncbi:MAG: SGNH/GDSL hydrolase family protein [Verrucomicrobia bacterium]|nr:SGNH/GDSL hydrolase family protein [Verrucomicrobiota bacterium]
MKTIGAVFLALIALATPTTLRAEHEGKIQILLLGDSTTEASFPKKYAPKEPQFEDVIRLLLAAEGDLPPVNVMNLGLSGEFIQRLIDSGRYEKQASKLPGLDYIFIRYGLNDNSKRTNFVENFPKDFHELLAKLRADHPKAVLIPMTVIPMADEATSTKINQLIREVAAGEKLTLFDIYPRYAAELKRGPDMLNYRRYPLAKVPEKFHELAKPYTTPGKDPTVVVMDNRLDGVFGHLPGWFGDRHPNLAGYNVIADETAKFLAPIIRERSGRDKGKP